MRHKRGFTLTELVMALAIMSVISVAVGGVAVALGKANERSEEYFECLQSGRVASQRIQGVLRKSLLVTAAQDGTLIAWGGDTNGNNQINLDELKRIYFKPATGEIVLKSLEIPSNLTSWVKSFLNPSVALDSVVDTAVADNTLGYVPSYDKERVIAVKVKSFKVTADAPAPLTQYLSFTIEVGDCDNTVTVYGGAKLRGEKTDWVAKSNNQFYVQVPGSNVVILPTNGDYGDIPGLEE